MPFSTRGPRRWARVLFFALVSFLAATAEAVCGQESSATNGDPFHVGSGVIEVDLRGTPLNLHFYKPSNYSGERFILLFHGASRAA